MDNTLAANIISAISATAAAVAAIAAWRAVKASRRGVEAQILLQLRTEFSSQPMHEAFRLLMILRLPVPVISSQTSESIIKSLISDIQFDFMIGTLEPFEKVIAVGEYDDYLFQWASKTR